MERMTALFQVGKVRPERRKPAALAAVLAAVMLITSACTSGAPADTSNPAQSNTPQPTETVPAEPSQDWPRVSGRLYRRGWQVDYQLALPEEYSGDVERGITSVALGMPGCSLALLAADEVPGEAAVLGGKTVRIENLDAGGKPIDNGASSGSEDADAIVCTGWYIPLDGERRLRLLWPTEEAELGEQVAATVTWSGLENNPEPDLPLPMAEQMGLTGDAAAIFDALQARYADPEQIPVRSRANDVMLPSITIWDSYEADGDTVLVCSVNEMFYYGVQLDGTCDGWGGGGSPTAFRGRCDENGNFQVAEIMSAMDGAGYAFSIRQMCGPLEELAEWLISGEGEQPEPIWDEMPGQDEMMRIYLAELGRMVTAGAFD